jgi:predicted transcriptional regulator of viral defense system
MNISRSLGRTNVKLLTTLAAAGKNIFSLADAIEATKGSPATTRRMLSYLVEKKWLIRLAPSKYLIVPLAAGEEGEHTENWYLIAGKLIEPAPYYISHLSALDIHETTIQPSFTVYISSPVRRKTKHALGADFHFIYVQPEDIWGIEEAWVTSNQKVRVSDFERTIIDCLDRPDLAGGISQVAYSLWIKRASTNYEHLVQYAERLGRKSVAKRLGFLLDTLGLGTPKLLSKLHGMATNSYPLLDPTLPASGRYLNAWKLRLNLEPEELTATAKT